MTIAAFPLPGAGRLPVTPHRLLCRNCGADFPAQPSAICEACLGPLEPRYDPARVLPSRAQIAARAPTLWRYHEWLPFRGAARLSLDSGFTPLVEAPTLARALGVGRAWVKNDSVSHPTLSFKDRVVAVALNAAAGFGLETVACASTGNLANAVAAHAARAGLPAWIFIPFDLEPAKLTASVVYGARVVRVRGTYDDVNRLCSQVADHFGWGVVNVNLRSYYGEGSKTVAFEITEQLGWRFPTVVIAPMAGGSLVSKLAQGFCEFLQAGLVAGAPPRLYGAQAQGCAPIVELVQRGGGPLHPVVPNTIARSLAIGNPADGPLAAHAIKESGGDAVAVSDAELAEGIALLARSTGIFGETAGGVTTAAARELARLGRLTPEDEVVLCITGNGLKTPDAIPARLLETPVIAPKLAEVAALAAATVS
ncbi:MAG TPA: threonine synthase [Gemmatimonadales bacterium]|nr:threonine synthase [Gemmatimonadales bacterium]